MPQHRDCIFWAVWAALATIGIAMAVLATQRAYFPYDIAITREWQAAVPGPLETVLGWMNGIEARERLAVASAILVYGLVRRRHWFAASFVVVPLLAQPLNGMLKAAVERPRPAASLVEVTEHASGSGFPSGHVMNSVIFFGFVAVIASDLVALRPLRVAVQACCLLIIALMGPARVWSGAHWPSDAAGGYMYGALVLMLIVWSYWRLRERTGARATGVVADGAGAPSPV